MELLLSGIIIGGGLCGVVVTLLYLSSHIPDIPETSYIPEVEDDRYKCIVSPERLEELRKERWQD